MTDHLFKKEEKKDKSVSDQTSDSVLFEKKIPVMHIKKGEENMELNSDSNKSSNLFQAPSIVNSSCSSNKEADSITPKCRNNLNLLFSESHGKKAQTPKRGMSNLKYHKLTQI